jgi:hypothetical protein
MTFFDKKKGGRQATLNESRAIRKDAGKIPSSASAVNADPSF